MEATIRGREWQRPCVSTGFGVHGATTTRASGNSFRCRSADQTLFETALPLPGQQSTIEQCRARSRAGSSRARPRYLAHGASRALHLVGAKAAFRHHHVNVVREFALYDFETGAAFVARHPRYSANSEGFSRNACRRCRSTKKSRKHSFGTKYLRSADENFVRKETSTLLPS